MVVQGQLLRDMEDIQKEMVAIQIRRHGSRRGKRKQLRQEERALRQELTERMYDLLDAQRRNQSV